MDFMSTHDTHYTNHFLVLILTILMDLCLCMFLLHVEYCSAIFLGNLIYLSLQGKM